MTFSYQDFNKDKQKFAEYDLRRIQKEISEMLADKMLKDGTLSKNNFLRIQSELNMYEKRMRDTMNIHVTDTIKDSAKFATSGIQKEFMDNFGGHFLPPDAMQQINENVIEYVANRFSGGPIVLSEKTWLESNTKQPNFVEGATWQTAAGIRDAIEQEIRTGIILGQSVSEIIPRVRKAFDAETWKIKRLVVTEGNTAYRTATAMSAERSEVVDWVQMHKGLADRDNHMCSILSKQDNYGMGEGIFKATDMQIYSPHPNCTGFITYVVNEGYSLEGLKERFGINPDGSMIGAEEEAPKTMTEPEIDKLFEGLTTKEEVAKELNRLTGASVDLEAFTFEEARTIAAEQSKLSVAYPMIHLKRFSSTQVENKLLRKAHMERNVIQFNDLIGNSANPRRSARTFWNSYKSNMPFPEDMPIDELIKKIADAATPHRRDSKRTLAWANRENTIAFNNAHKGKRSNRNTEGAAGTKRWMANDSFPSIAKHEFGHMVDFHIAQNFPVERERVIGQMWKDLGSSGVKKQISTYGGTNDLEMFAEAFSDVHSNKGEAADVSVKLVNEVRKILGLGAYSYD